MSNTVASTPYVVETETCGSPVDTSLPGEMLSNTGTLWLTIRITTAFVESSSARNSKLSPRAMLIYLVLPNPLQMKMRNFLVRKRVLCDDCVTMALCIENGNNERQYPTQHLTTQGVTSLKRFESNSCLTASQIKHECH